MQHIIPIAFEFDDVTVRRYIETNAEKAITEDLKRQVAERIFQKKSYFAGYYVGDEYTDDLTDFAAGIVSGFLEAHKDEIIQAAGKELAEKLARTKAGKAALALAQGGDSP